MKKIYLLLISFICLNLGTAQAQTSVNLAGFGTTNTDATGETATVTNLTAQGFVRSDVDHVGSTDDTDYKSSGWDAVSLAHATVINEYIGWSVTSNALLSTNIDRLRIQLKNNGQGPTHFKIFYSTNNFATPQDHVELTPGDETLSATAVSYDYTGLAITVAPSATISFRLYAWGATDTSYGELAIVANTSSWKIGTNPLSPGAVVSGALISDYNGLSYINNVWYPKAPSSDMQDLRDVRVLSGTYTISDRVNVKNLTVIAPGKLVIARTGTLKVHGHLATGDNVTIESNSTRFGSLLIDNLMDEDDEEILNPAKVTGTATYKRFVNAVTSGNDLISAPVSGQSFTDFLVVNKFNIAQDAAGTQFLFGPFNKTTGDYDLYTNTTTTPLAAGIGYRVGTQFKGALTFNGGVTIGTINIPIGQSGPQSKEWNLIGNPYTAYINVSAFLDRNTGILHDEAVAVYGYNPSLTQKWVIYNEASIVGDPSLTIAPGQGFYVAAKEVSGSSIRFLRRMMVESTNDDFVAGRTEAEKAPHGYIKLNLSNEGKDYTTELYFLNKASKGLDLGYDAKVYGGKAGKLSIYSNLVEDNKGTSMGIQAVGYSDLTNGVIIPIGIHVSQGMQVTVNIADFNLPEGVEVYLEDNSNNTFTLLNTSDYTFTAASNITKTGRFFLHVGTKPLSNKDDILNGLQIYTANNSKILYVKGLIKDQSQLNIFDIQGRIMTATSLKANTNSNEVDMSNMGTGVYVVELKSNGSVKTQKVILK